MRTWLMPVILAGFLMVGAPFAKAETRRVGDIVWVRSFCSDKAGLQYGMAHTVEGMEDVNDLWVSLFKRGSCLLAGQMQVKLFRWLNSYRVDGELASMWEALVSPMSSATVFIVLTADGGDHPDEDWIEEN